MICCEHMQRLRRAARKSASPSRREAGHGEGDSCTIHHLVEDISVWGAHLQKKWLAMVVPGQYSKTSQTNFSVTITS